ncbi:MAG: protein kinase [Leptospiraceae bacterium]|nr:protein kinase [Leptospiraceae bacterium]MCP5497408.1 protein kinase [Leptospiraceae bacterium]
MALSNTENIIKPCPVCGTKNRDLTKACLNCGYSFEISQEERDLDLELLQKTLSPKYDVLRKIGIGGSSTVYLGIQTALERKVVIKMLNPEYAEEKELIDRFLLEARTTARLKHPNIVEVFDVGLCGERPYYIMEFAPNGSVSEKLKRYKREGKTFPPQDAIQLVIKILKALDYCHNNKLQSHRDIKPSNIMFNETGEPIIVDFGIAKIFGEFRTKNKITMGTVNYMSPEQCHGKKDIDGRSDIYSVGIVLFELLTGETPYKGDSDISIMIKQVKEKIPTLTSKLKLDLKNNKGNAELYRKLESIINKACAKNKKKRFQTALEFAEELEKFAQTPLSKNTHGPHFIRNLSLIVSGLLLGIGIGGFLGYKTIWKGEPKEKIITEEKNKSNKNAIPPRVKEDQIEENFPNDSVNEEPAIIIETDPPGAMIVNIETGLIDGYTPFTTIKSELYKYKAVMDGYKEEFIDSKRFRDQAKSHKMKITLDKHKTKHPQIKKHEKTEKHPKEEKETIKKPVKKEPANQDITTGNLVWQSSDIRKMSWFSAVTHCKAKGMRLPSIEDLRVGYRANKKAFTSPCCGYWTENEYEEDPDDAYNVSMKNFQYFYAPKANKFYVRCVK